MPLPEYGTVPVHGGSVDPKPAHLIRFPEHLVEQLDAMACNGEKFMISMEGGPTLVFPNGDRIALQAQTIGNPTEIHQLDSTGALEPIALASARLSVPLSASTSAKAAERVREQTEARDREKKANADRINGVPKPRTVTLPPAAVAAQAASMARTQSSPAATVTTGPPTPVIPLKTKVIQHLALGPCPQADIVQRLRQPEVDIMRVVNVVGRRTSAKIPTFELQPTQYAKIKIADWPYTSSELKTVCALARKAFDELKLPPDADERLELDRKEAAAAPSPPKSTSISPTGSAIIALKPIGPKMHPLPPKPASVATYSNNNSRPQSRPGSQPSSSRPGSQVQSRTGSHSTSPPMNQTSQVPLPPTAPVGDHHKQQAPASVRRGTEYKIPKKDQSQKTVIGRQLDKYRAEKRAASLPNGKADSRGTSPPRVISTPHASGSSSSKAAAGLSTSAKARESSTSDEKNPPKSTKPTKVRRDSKRSHTPSESEDEKEERPKKMTAAEKRRASKLPSPDYSSSTDEEAHAHRGRPIAKRSSPPPAKPSPSAKANAKANGHAHVHVSTTANGHSSPPPTPPLKSPEEMRERYEELYPAYQQLARKLTAIYQSCEDVEVEGRLNVSKEEVAKLAARYKKWHTELAEIRQWFDVESAA